MKMLYLSLILCLLPVGLTGCAPTYTGPTPEQIALREKREAESRRQREEWRQRNRERKQQIKDLIQAGTDSLNRYQQGDAAAAREGVQHMFKLSEYARVYTATDSEPEGMWSRNGHTALAFALAKEALEQGHLDASEMIYRHLIEFYSGLAYAGIRDRAMLGLEDVRRAR